ncbi:MAG: hypothetical protein COT28_15440 [Methylobacterium sp. CG08_land_8_20_14_0_20_71_15]|nr:MAG: hypothetical protein COT56_13595 [Methylobacterium sp. CG09_land_8_20_14_0_10_71_15]PIU12383.1 MAG: hypothetical protein COT28_15440 [Methylobacterium sp. CG08_land_8_20_14_0_20_71_15]GBU16895.1 hypothetical protein AwMethylo_11100 [Methylobacterium sp.]
MIDMRSLIVLLALTTTVAAEPVTKAERAWIVDYMTQTLRDPYSIRSTGISEVRPLTGDAGRTIPAGICVRYNAKNGYGAYGGIDTLVFVRTPTGLVYGDWRHAVSTKTCWVDNVVYGPFPELANLK